MSVDQSSILFLCMFIYFFLDKGTVYQAIKSEGVTQKLSREDVVTLKAQGATGKVKISLPHH